MKTIEVLVPVADVPVKEIEMAQRPLAIHRKTIGFLWNRKPNGNLLLKHLEKALNKKYHLQGTWTREKSFSSSQASPEVLEDLSARCDLVILAIGDWGSCISWCIHDAIELEKRGTPTISICTDEFSFLGSMEASALQMPRLPIVFIPHPLGGLNPREVEERGKIALRDIITILDRKRI